MKHLLGVFRYVVVGICEDITELVIGRVHLGSVFRSCNFENF